MLNTYYFIGLTQTCRAKHGLTETENVQLTFRSNHFVKLCRSAGHFAMQLLCLLLAYSDCTTVIVSNKSERSFFKSNKRKTSNEKKEQSNEEKYGTTLLAAACVFFCVSCVRLRYERQINMVFYRNEFIRQQWSTNPAERSSKIGFEFKRIIHSCLLHLLFFALFPASN